MAENKNESNKAPAVHTGHRKRMKERFFNGGAANFADHELIEMLLYNTFPRKDTNELAHKILNEYDNNLCMLVEADPADLMFRCGLNENTAMFFSIMSEILRRYSAQRYKKRTLIDSSEIAGNYAVYLLANEKRECFYVICLDAQSRLINSSLISRGTVNETHVYIRNVAEAAVKYNARSIILAHNHPGGGLVPSVSDIETTVSIIKMLNMIDVYVSDHIIVADDKYLSMADEGLVKNSI